MDSLMEELNEYSRDYSKQIEDTPSHLLFQNLPRVFCVGDFTTFCNKLEAADVDKAFVYRSLCFKSRALWNAGKFSKSLTSLAVAAEFWLTNLNAANRFGSLSSLHRTQLSPKLLSSYKDLPSLKSSCLMLPTNLASSYFISPS